MDLWDAGWDWDAYHRQLNRPFDAETLELLRRISASVQPHMDQLRCVIVIGQRQRLPGSSDETNFMVYQKQDGTPDSLLPDLLWRFYHKTLMYLVAAPHQEWRPYVWPPGGSDVSS